MANLAVKFDTLNEVVKSIYLAEENLERKSTLWTNRSVRKMFEMPLFIMGGPGSSPLKGPFLPEEQNISKNRQTTVVLPSIKI